MFIIINVNVEFVNVRECYATILLTAIKNSGQSLPEEEQLSAILSMLFSQSAWVFGSLTDLYLQKSDLLNYMLLIRKFHL